MTAISVSERLLEMAAFYTPLALTVTQEIQNHGSPATCSHAFYRPKKPRGQSLG